MEGLKIGTKRSDAQASDVLGHVKPVRANVGHAARSTASLGVDAPVPVRVVEQPVLRVGALDDEDLAQIAGFSHAAQLLHHGVIAQIVADTVAKPFSAAKATSSSASSTVVASGFSQATCLPASSASLAMEKCSALGVQMWTASMVGSRKISGSRCDRGDVEALSQTPRQVDVRVYDGSGLDRFQPPNRIQMHPAHKAGAEDCRLDLFHRVLDSLRYARRTRRPILRQIALKAGNVPVSDCPSKALGRQMRAPERERRAHPCRSLPNPLESFLAFRKPGQAQSKDS